LGKVLVNQNKVKKGEKSCPNKNKALIGLPSSNNKLNGMESHFPKNFWVLKKVPIDPRKE